ncbi:MAG: serine/threonine-protein kinase, partial [Dokdonella sp.]
MTQALPIDADRWVRLKDHVADLASLDLPAREQALADLTLDADDRDWLQRLSLPLLADDPRLMDSHPSARATAEYGNLRWRAGDTIGRYRIEALLGRGGMGEVYEARSLDDGQLVALKVLRAGLEQSDYARFSENEQRALQRLDDPRIARFIEAFEADGVGTCLVLEWIDGEPLQSHCRSRRFNVEARLKLFIDVCQAVASAHQLLVVHRDLKPSNVLVTPEGQVKLLDFGVSKLLDENTTHTQTHGNLYTLEYAAPEQVLHEPVSTATDIYALGGLLYRLLTDVSPYALGDGGSLVKAVLSESPQRLDHALARSRAAGHAPPIGLLDRDLDRVIARSMNKDPRSRYPNARELASDIQAILSGRPISHGGGTGYRLKKLLKRHRAVAAAAIVASLSLVGATVVSLHEARLAVAHAHRADVANQFLLTTLDMSDRFSSNNHGDVTLGDVLEHAVAQAHTELRDEPQARAAVLGQLGLALQHRGKAALALTAGQEALALRTSDPESSALEKANAAQQLASIEIELGHLDDASTHSNAALQWLDQEPAQSPIRIATLTSLGKLASMRGDAEGSLRWYQKIIPLREALAGDYRAEIAMDYNNLGTGLYNLSRFREADLAFAHGIALLHAQFGATHPRLGYIEFGRAAALTQLGRFDEAEKTLAAADLSLNGGDQAKGNQPGSVNTERMRAVLDFYASNYASALRRLSNVLPQTRASSPISVAATLMIRGRIELASGNPIAAIATLAEAEKLYVDNGRSAHAQRWVVHGLHGAAAGVSGNVRDGDRELEEAFAQLAGDGSKQGIELAEMALLSGAAARRRADI